jgi:hypothetical protein
MRCLLKVSIPVETGNAAITDGSLGKTIESILADLKDQSQIPAVAEPWFLAFDAHIEVQPAMNLEDLKNAGPGIERAVKNYRRTAQKKAA